MSFTTRFAPSPTGPLHLGHAYSALLAHDMARAVGGRFLLRIEDIDQTRARPEWEALIYEDLRWLGITWDGPVMRQSDRLPAYHAALETLWGRGLLYPCTCNRRDILAAVSAPHGAPDYGPDGVIYPGTCRTVPKGALPEGEALRLNIGRAATGPLTCTEEGGLADRTQTTPSDTTRTIGDIVLSRRDFFGSYHLSVVVDDAAQGISHVVRGHDLFQATAIHVILQHLLDLPTPIYHHHRLITDDSGKRLAKRDDARAIRTYREDGARPQDIRRMIGLGSGPLNPAALV